MKRLMAAFVALVFVGLVGPVSAADNPTGTWKWTATFGGQEREQTLTLKLDGDKLTGSMPGRDDAGHADCRCELQGQQGELFGHPRIQRAEADDQVRRHGQRRHDQQARPFGTVTATSPQPTG